MPEPPRARDFVNDLEPALRQAAAIARALEGRVANRPKADEETPAKAALTIADTATQEALLVPLAPRFGRVHLEAEEDTPSVSRFEGTIDDWRIVIDPIDGTLRFYLEQGGPYAVMAGLAIRGRFEAALVALPRERLLFAAVRGDGARCARGEEDFRPVAAAAGRGRAVLVSDGMPEPVQQGLREQGYEVAFGSGGAVAVAPLIPGVRAGLRLAREGSISRRGRIGVLIAREAGACVAGASGEPFPDAIDAPAPALLVAAETEDLEALRRALAALG